MHCSISFHLFFPVVTLIFLGACINEHPPLPPAYNHGSKITDGYLNAVSTDGSRIALTRQDSLSPYNIYICTSNGDNARKVAVGKHPAFSPDGSKIAFTRFNYAGSFWYYQLLSIDLGTMRETMILPDSFRYEIENITWSPDGAKISCRYDSSGFVTTKIVSSNGAGKVHNTLRAVYISWSPDGDRFVGLRSGKYQMFIGSVGSDHTQPIGIGYGPDEPVWMPDGNTIAYLQWYTGIFTYHFVSENIDSVQFSDLTSMTSLSQALQISRNGKKVVSHIRDFGNPDVPPSSTIKYFSLSQKKITSIAFVYGELSNPLWSPDAAHLYFTRSGDRYEVYRYSTND